MPLVDLGVHPTAPSQSTALGKSLTAAHVSNGKVYFGFGDTFVNTGPIDIRRYNIATALWETVISGTASTERIGRFRKILDQLWASLDDPKSSTDPTILLCEAPSTGHALATGTSILTNLLSANASSLETDVSDYFATTTNNTVERSVDFALHGTASLKMTRVSTLGVLNVELKNTSRPTIIGDQLYIAHAQIRPSVTGNYRVDIVFYDEAGTILFENLGVLTNANANAWTQIYSAAPAPEGATRAGIRVGSGPGNLNAGATIYVDKISINRWAFLEWVLGGTTGSANWRPVHTYDMGERVAGEIYLAGGWNTTAGAGLLRSVDNGSFPRNNWEVAVNAADYGAGDDRFYNVGILDGKIYTVMGYSIDGGTPQEQYILDAEHPCYIYDGVTVTRGPVLYGFIKPVNFAGVLVYRSLSDQLVSFNGTDIVMRLDSTCVDHYVEGNLIYAVQNGRVLRSSNLTQWTDMGPAPATTTSLAVSNGAPYFGTSDSKIWKLNSEIFATSTGNAISTGDMSTVIPGAAIAHQISSSGISSTTGSVGVTVNVPGKISATGFATSSGTLISRRLFRGTAAGNSFSDGSIGAVIPGESVRPSGPYKSGVVVIACNKSGVPISPINGVKVSDPTWELNSPGTARISANPIEPTLRHIKINEMEIQIWIDDELRWWGVPRSMSGDAKEVTFMCEGLLSHFSYRVVTMSLLYTSIDQYNIAVNLVNFAQYGTNMDRNIKFASTVSSGVIRSREYKAEEKEVILDLLQEFNEIDRGFDFDVKVFPDGRREFTPYYPSKGILRTNLRLEWGRNIVDYKYNEDGADQGTRVWAQGGTDSNGARREQNYEDVAKSAKYGVMHRVVSEGNQLDPTWLADRAKEEVRSKGDPVKLPELIVKNDPVQLFGVIETGDILPILLQHGRYDINENLRVVKIVRLDNGHLSLTFNRVG